ATLLRPLSSAATVAGIDVVADPEAVRRKIGVVFQSSSLDKVLTVDANLRFQGQLYGLSGPELEGRISAMLARLDLGDKLEARVDDGAVRLEREDGAHFVPELVSAFGKDVRSVKVGRPTLEDVFLKKTGRRLGTP